MENIEINFAVKVDTEGRVSITASGVGTPTLAQLVGVSIELTEALDTISAKLANN